MRFRIFLLLLLLLTGLAVPPGVLAEQDFARDIQPLLTEYCYACHGPDAAAREAGLRLDQRAAAFAELASGRRAIRPGNRDQSELYARLTVADLDRRMPPAEFGKRPTTEQIERIGRWIDQGASWPAHWAYLPPRRPAVPQLTTIAQVSSDVSEGSESRGPRNPIDAFVLGRLEIERLGPSPPADKPRLLRRVTLALTGLPPTPGELAAFLADERPGAYERVVDRLLASPRYGEHMARSWLDLARYADTHGYHIDSHRDMWPWRDWVIDSYNRNQPFDQFTVEQLAGDLLPNATTEQQIASGFNRNNMINFEGGALPEEYLVEYVADRVVTTSTVWMAQTLTCSRCHDHKYDPFTQRDFFRLFAYFNSVPEEGLDGRTGNAAPFIDAPTDRQRRRIVVLEEQIARGHERLAERATQAVEAQRAWERRLRGEQTSSTSLDATRQAPSDAILACPLDETAGSETLESIDNRKLPIQGPVLWLPGKYGHALLFGGRTHVELGDAGPVDRDQAYSLSVWIYPTTEDPMTIIARQDPAEGRQVAAETQQDPAAARQDPAAARRGWRVGLEDGRPVVELVHDAGGNALRVRGRQTVERRQWQHLAVTYDGSSTAAGVQIYLDGTPSEVEVTSDNLRDSIALKGQSPRLGNDPDGRGFRGLLDELRLYGRELNGTDVGLLAGSDPIGEIVAIDPPRRSPAQRETLRQYYLEHHDAVSMDLRREVAAAETLLAALRRGVTTTMVMRDAAEPRPTHILMRGDYRYPGEVVTAGTPDSLPPMPDDAPPNRLGLARWLVDPDHPLTARVAVNRYWQQFFGEGLVRTPEDFGSRGERPTHPELLDWLATEFIRSGWDRKHVQRLIVTSATYRQASGWTKSLRQRDPENRLLARGPRHRLAAETIRDSALYAAGLLDERIGGPSVYPYQPKGLWKEVSFNPRDFTAQVYTQSSGADLYRRSLYTFWKRAVPPPPLALFDAPNRETCSVRRPRTNTPLQALVLMNEPGFVEAARGLAERVLSSRAESFDERLDLAFQLTLTRHPTPAETVILRSTWEKQRDEFAADREAARALLSVGQSARRGELDLVESAAWTFLAGILLNLDETVNH